jgi:SAM-dependent methyltransferase
MSSLAAAHHSTQFFCAAAIGAAISVLAGFEEPATMNAALKHLANRLDLKERIRAGEDWWFDSTRHVRTAGNGVAPIASEIVGELRDGCIYAPVRAANARAALRDLPISDCSKYTFIDLGSGKGRMLFVAAEFAFRRVVGVEFSSELHRLAQENLKSYCHRGRRCGDIKAVLADAAEFEFPGDQLVLYLFNPFGPEAMGRMLANLESSLRERPRHVVVVMLWPEQAELVARMPGMQAYRQTRRYHIYQTAQE